MMAITKNISDFDAVRLCLKPELFCDQYKARCFALVASQDLINMQLHLNDLSFFLAWAYDAVFHSENMPFVNAAVFAALKELQGIQRQSGIPMDEEIVFFILSTMSEDRVVRLLNSHF